MADAITLYDLASEYRRLYYDIINSADAETGEVDSDIALELSAIEGNLQEKAVSVATVSRAVSATVDQIKNEIARLTEMQKKLENRNARVKEYLKQALDTAGIEKIQGISATISFRKSEQTVIDNEAAIPDEYMTVKTTYTPNKTAIKAAIKAGKQIDGAHIETCRNIQIK